MTRDITPPLRDPEPRARGGMTVVDESAWKRAINEYTKAESIAFLRAADQFASGVEKHMRARPDLSFEVVCAGIGEAPLAPDAAALREFWIYGERFWAWWLRHEGLRECRLDDEAAVPPVVITLAVEGPDRSAETLDALSRSLDPRPVLTLADGSTVRADEVWESLSWSWANVGGAPFLRPGLGCPWQPWQPSRTKRPRPYRSGEYPVFDAPRVYPPAEAKPTVNAHGVDVGRIRAGDYVRTDAGNWCRVIGETAGGAQFIADAGPNDRDEPGGLWPRHVTEHRAAPRITLPDGREVTPERMWRQRSEFGNLEIVQVEGRCFVHRPSESWEPADYWTRNVPDPNYYRRVWPPADVEGV